MNVGDAVKHCGGNYECRGMSCSFMDGQPITLDRILHSEISLKDKFWVLCKKLAVQDQNKQIAIRVAEIVLPLYERRYSDDARPRDAINAAKQFLSGHISEKDLWLKGRAAAYAAAGAADAIKKELQEYLYSFIV